MKIAGVDLGSRKAAVSIIGDEFVSGVLELVTPGMPRDKELRSIAHWVGLEVQDCDAVFIEEPLVGRGVRASLQIAQVAGAIMSEVAGLDQLKCYLVPNKSWKKELIGNGNADKAAIRTWLTQHYPSYAAYCGANQDQYDATCIGLYGAAVYERAQHLDEL